MRFRLFSYTAILFALLFWISPDEGLGYRKQNTFSLDEEKPSYEAAWKKVDSLIYKGLSRSALTVVEEIYALAEKENNTPQQIKTIIHRMKLESYFEEFSEEKAIDRLKKEIAKSSYPLTPILHSILAETYWKYYQNHRWQISERSFGAKLTDDISTWDIKTIVDQSVKHYQASLLQAEKTKNIPINDFSEILLNKEENFKAALDLTLRRPTLYDFLAHRALDFYSSAEAAISRPAAMFRIKDQKYFGTAQEFLSLNEETEDSLSFDFYALNILQELMRFHIKDQAPDALVDIHLKRFSFLKNKAFIPFKDSLYMLSLSKLEEQLLSYPVATEISYALAQEYNRKGDEYNFEISQENRWMKKIAMETCSRAISRFPNAYGASLCKQLMSNIRSKNLHVTMERTSPADQAFNFLLNYQNVDKVYLRVIKIPFDDYRHPTQFQTREVMLTHYINQSPLLSRSKKLPATGDYQNHKIELALEGLGFGNYILLLGTDTNFTFLNGAVAFTNFSISNISYVRRKNSDQSSTLCILNRVSGIPIEGALLALLEKEYSQGEYKYKKTASYVSDKDGLVHIPASKTHANYELAIRYYNDSLISGESFYRYPYYKEKKNQKRTTFFTDRSIYRPGQTIYFKGLVLESDGEAHQILANHKTTVRLYDVNYQEVSKMDFTTNEFGTFQGSFTAPAGGMNGYMQIGDEYGSTSISVEEYKRPKFEVKINPIKGSYRLGDSVSLSGKAINYAGNAVDGASVKYRIVREAHFPYWHFRYAFMPTSQSIEIVNGEITTNDSGYFHIHFLALADEQVKKKFSPTFTYAVYADVTDISGETQSAETQVQIAYQALKLAVDMPNKFNKDSLEKIKISTSNYSNEMVPAKVEVKIFRLQSPKKLIRKKMWDNPDQFEMDKKEYDLLFPHDIYANENDIKKWKKEEKVYENVIFTGKTTHISPENIKKWNSGTYLIEASTKDKYGQEIITTNDFILYDLDEKTVPQNTYDWFHAIKNSGEPGEAAKFLIGSAAKKVNVFFEIEHKGEILSKEWLTIDQGQKIISVPIEEKHRGNFVAHFTFVKDNRIYQHDEVIIVPWSNKELDIQFETFRDKIQPGAKEAWQIKISGDKNNLVAAEMVAAMYDASLDAFKPHQWTFNLYSTYSAQSSWTSYYSFTSVASLFYQNKWNEYHRAEAIYYPQLNWFGYSGHYSRGRRSYYGDVEIAYESNMAPAAAMDDVSEKSMKEEETSSKQKLSGNKDKKEEGDFKFTADSTEPKIDLSQVKARSNLNETAFFYPNLKTDEAGNIIISFTSPEALTRWKVLGFAHTKDLHYGFAEKELITQKELMVMPNPPRFFREKDTIYFSAKVNTLQEENLKGEAQLFLYDPSTLKSVDANFQHEKKKLSFEVSKGKSAVLNWKLIIPEGIAAVKYKIVAATNTFSDGEEMILPILSNRMLVTEALPLSVRGNESKTFTFEKLKNTQSSTLKHHQLSLEFSSNPAWYAIQALPYLMEYPYECSEQTFNRFYANSIAAHVANSSPKIKAVFDQWSNYTPDALLSNLEKNQDLKNVFLEETPWVMQAKNESERKKRIALLFDFNKMTNELALSKKKLMQQQLHSGAWSWFEGMSENRYITQYIVAGMGHLARLGINNDDVKQMLHKAIAYMDNEIVKDYEDLLKHYSAGMEENHLSSTAIQYLYARSYFNEVKLSEKSRKAFEYYKLQAEKYWTQQNIYLQGMIALSLNRFQMNKMAKDIVRSLKENSIQKEELGMYWKNYQQGYYWHQSPIEMQALMIEVFDEVAADEKAVEELKIYLLKHKQCNDWKTTKATAEACYALLMRGTSFLATENNVSISLGGKAIVPEKTEAGTGYFKTSWTGSEITSDMAKVSLTKSDEGIAWGAIYWQYFEQLDKITSHETPLTLKKELYVEELTNSGTKITLLEKGRELKKGDKIKVRMVLTVDRDMEYVHMKDMRAAALEPINIMSGYKWQDGLGYYESTKDASANFFFSFLRKGTYVFEYPLKVSQSGTFSNGITSIQCMYAPEFGSHSEGVRILVKE